MLVRVCLPSEPPIGPASECNGCWRTMTGGRLSRSAAMAVRSDYFASARVPVVVSVRRWGFGELLGSRVSAARQHATTSARGAPVSARSTAAIRSRSASGNARSRSFLRTALPWGNNRPRSTERGPLHCGNSTSPDRGACVTEVRRTLERQGRRLPNCSYLVFHNTACSGSSWSSASTPTT